MVWVKKTEPPQARQSRFSRRARRALSEGASVD